MKPNLILLGLSSLLSAGCGLLLANAPPTGHEQMDSFSCTEKDAAPLLDALGSGAAVLAAASAVEMPGFHDNSGRIVTVGLAWGVVSGLSAAKGFKKAKRCRAAYRQLAIRHGQHPADLPPEGPFVQAVVVSRDTRLAVGEQRQLSAMAYASSAALMPDRPFLWTSSNDAIASVSNAGLVTAHAAIAPDAAMQSSFGQTLDGPLAELIVRNWGLLVGLVGLMLIYGAFVPPARRLVLSVAALSKGVFVILLLTVGRDYLDQMIRIAVVVDGLEALLFTAYLLTTRHAPRPPRPEPVRV